VLVFVDLVLWFGCLCCLHLVGVCCVEYSLGVRLLLVLGCRRCGWVIVCGVGLLCFGFRGLFCSLRGLVWVGAGFALSFALCVRLVYGFISFFALCVW